MVYAEFGSIVVVVVVGVKAGENGSVIRDGGKGVVWLWLSVFVNAGE